MQLVRSICNDTFTGIAGVQGRIFTNDAPFTIPFFNSAFRTLQRKLRNQGVTFPIKDNVILTNVTPVITVDPSVQIYIGFDGYFDGTTLHPTPRLPSDLLQPYVLRERITGSAMPFSGPMEQPQEGLPSVIQGRWLGMWEWRNYKIYMPGGTQTEDLSLRYKSGQAPLNAPAASFATTTVGILDCQDAIANLMASLYGNRNGASDAQIAKVDKAAEEAIDDMAEEAIRRSQTVPYRRQAYNDGGAGAGNAGPIGQTSVGNSGN